ncbi:MULTISPECIES: SixA phosphatase family protein [Streptomyces]|uniref:SixA phosphatase family protein n=1 Tax=Streptomyces TaxID=1883 RepID=UPI0004BD01B2|nr:MULTISPECIES: histidine phosphatase family protein [Streptomyces]KOU85149.1 phosphohistidine phosphatase [Streptomyces sp. XY593]KOV17511.1 phosphohistidine phosphatase [Streptomyces sp. XY511]MCI4085017.1 histidine phosphatase family protein [Streptomyces sp. MMS21 TC-5]RST15725.1 histidine phosphatase family protein [Streptomyces sp. WAC05950]GLV91932.1 phosphohistidine phosphatase [Streptomyces lavendulae subsp. lavendulae]
MSSDAGPHTTGCRLLLVRHAKAVPKGDPAEDFERPLGERGKADAPRTGRWLAENGYTADLALCSPSRRTRQTWQLLVPALPDPPDAVYDERLYNAAPNALVTVMTERGAGLGRLALVGHNTGIHELATALCGTGPAELLEQLRDGFPTSGVVVVDLAGGWADLTPGRGHLAAMWSPAH